YVGAVHGTRQNFFEGSTSASSCQARRRIAFGEHLQESIQRGIFVVVPPVRCIAQSTWPSAVTQLSIHQTREIGANVRFQNKADAHVHCDEALHNAATDVVALNLWTILWRNKLRNQQILKLTPWIILA